MPKLPLFYGKPIDTPVGHKWAGESENPFRTGDHVINVNPNSEDYRVHGVVYSVRGDIILVTLDNSTGAIQFHFTHFVSLEA